MNRARRVAAPSGAKRSVVGRGGDRPSVFVVGYRLGRLFSLVLLFSFVSISEAASFSVQFEPAVGDEHQDARAFIQDEGVSETVRALLVSEFRPRVDLEIWFTGDGAPDYERGRSRITIPYDFVYQISDRFHRSFPGETDQDVYDVTRDALLHALLHLVSHALYDMYGFRASGNEESAIDALTTLLLIKYYDDGGEIALNAASLYSRRGGAVDKSVSGDFWSRHDLGLQGYYQTLCLVYGSDPEKYAWLRQESQFVQARGGDCAREFRRQTDVWFRALSQHLKRPPPE